MTFRRGDYVSPKGRLTRHIIHAENRPYQLIFFLLFISKSTLEITLIAIKLKQYLFHVLRISESRVKLVNGKGIPLGLQSLTSEFDVILTLLVCIKCLMFCIVYPVDCYTM